MSGGRKPVVTNPWNKRKLLLDDVAERKRRIGLGKPTDLYPELGLRIDRATHHRAGPAHLFMQFVVYLYQAHSFRPVVTIYVSYTNHMQAGQLHVCSCTLY